MERMSIRASTKMQIASDYAAPLEDTPLEKAVDGTWDEAGGFVDRIPNIEKDSLAWEPALTGAIFCGHLMADCDSISGAIAAAHLYGGEAARASELNSETKYALERWGVAEPKSVEELLEADPSRKVCLVDFQQQTQMNSSIPMKNIVGIIDHHALQSSTIVTERPVFVDIRPWGSMCSILAHSYAVQEKFLPKNIAGMLLSAILSDTLNLRSPTTTKWDERMVSMLVQYIDASMDVNEFASTQFRAKSHELSLMSAYQLVNGDTKTFKFALEDGSTTTVSYGVIETTDAPTSIARVDELIEEMKAVKIEKGFLCMFVAIVDIVNLSSHLIIVGEKELSLAEMAYAGEIIDDGKFMFLKDKVSRKSDFIPPLTRAFELGWVPPEEKKAKKPNDLRRSRVMMMYNKYASGRLERIMDDVKEED